jgi:MFS family permease
VLGFGSGTLGVTRSFVVEQTAQAKRTEALSFVTALQYAGFTVSPFLGSILAWVGSLRSGRMAYWTFALPAYFIAIVSLGCVIALQLYFVDIHHADAEEYKVAEVMKHTLPSNTELSSMNSMNNMGGGSHERREIATYSPQKDYQSVMQDTFPTIESADLPRNKSSQPDSSEVRRMCSDDIEAMIKKANFESSDALVTRLLEEPHCNETDSRTEKGGTGNENSNDKQHLPDSAIESEKVTAKQVRLCLFIMIVLNLTTKGTIAVYETLGVHMALEDYEMTVQSIGAIISLSGLIGFVQLLLFKPFWTKFFNDFALMLGGIAVMIIAQLLLLCYTKESHMWRFMVTIVLMYAVGYPIGHTAVLGAFSKIKKSGPQAALLGWFATAGSLARVILPVMSAYLDR